MNPNRTPKHRAEPSDWTRSIEAKREREIEHMHRIYAARVIPAGFGKHRDNETQTEEVA